MIEAAELEAGNTVKLDGDIYHVLSAEYHAGGGQFGGMVFVRLKNLKTNHVRELRFHPDDKLQDITLERQVMEYLYTDGDAFYFMHPETFEQLSLAKEAIGPYEKFLQPNMRIPVELFEDTPIRVVFPETVEFKVVVAPPGLREHETATYKTVVLENGLEVLAPQFIKEGDIVKVEVATGKYLERVRRDGKKG
jgi:elongation factor P